jgi:hypothetical protein
MWSHFTFGTPPVVTSAPPLPFRKRREGCSSGLGTAN